MQSLFLENKMQINSQKLSLPFTHSARRHPNVNAFAVDRFTNPDQAVEILFVQQETPALVVQARNHWVWADTFCHHG